MANRSFYVDEIYRNENGDFYTGLALEHNEWLKDRYKFEKVADPYTTCRGKTVVKSHIVYRLCNHMVYTLSLIQPGVIVQEIALFECVNSLVQVDAADSELSEHQCDLPRERRLANGDAFPTKPFA